MVVSVSRSLSIAKPLQHHTSKIEKLRGRNKFQ